jgi:hypothetical protein
VPAEEWLCLPCGAVNRPRATFCADCGSPQPGPNRWSAPPRPRQRRPEPAYAEPAYAEPARPEPAYAELPYAELPYAELPYAELPYIEPGYSDQHYGEPPPTEPPFDDQPRAGRSGTSWPGSAPLDYRPLDERWPDDPWIDEPDTTPFGPDPVLYAPGTELVPRPVRRVTPPPEPTPRLPLAGRIAVTVVIIGVLIASSVAVANMIGWSPFPRTTAHQPPAATPLVDPTGTASLPGATPPSTSPSAPSPSPSAPTPSRSPSRSASATPTPTPTPSRPGVTPTPTPPPTAIGIVDVRAVSTNPHVRAVGGLFDTYFNGINLKRYDQTLALFDPSGALNPNDPQQAANFTQGVSTSVDSDVVIRSIVDGAAADLVTRITFRSHQSPGFGPVGAPNETCTIWDSTYQLRPNTNGVYLIFDELTFTHQSC